MEKKALFLEKGHFVVKYYEGQIADFFWIIPCTGTVERQNKVLLQAFNKILEDVSCELEEVLACALHAKNGLQISGGFPPNQLVFEHNVNNSSALTEKLPPRLSEIVRKNINALHSARKNFVQTENSENITRALRHQARTYTDEIYENEI